MSEHVVHRHKHAMLIIDMLNTLDFPDGEKLLKQSLPVAEAIKKLKQRLKRQGVPILYVNDNFGQWRSSWQEVYEACASEKSRGAPLARLLKPEDDDYFVMKPKHSGFYSTNLDVLLEELGTETLILTGIAGNICVLFTANDAHMRDFEIFVPKDCIASNTKADNDYTIQQLREVFHSDTRASASLRLSTRKRK